MLLGCSRPEAEDAVQTALVKCLVHWRRVANAENPHAYVYRILVNTLNSSRRRRWRGEVPHDQLPEPDVTAVPDQAAQFEDADVVRRALARLTRDQRDAVVLRYYSGLTEAQMADALNVASGTVKSRLSRALKILAADPDLAQLGGVTP